MIKRIASSLCCAALLWVIPASADQWDKKTTVTFSQPVELPGIVLPAGTYVFKLLDSASNRHIVEVFNAEENHLYTIILAIPNYRLTPTEETVLRFEERKRNQPEAIRAWFYPADNFGQEFVYPKKRAAELAEATNLPVLTAAVTPTEKPEELIKEPVVAITPEKKEVEVPEVPTQAPIKTEPPVIANAEPAPQPAPAAPTQELPKTASPLPTLVTAGICSLGLFALLRALSKRVA
jgi:hypothetical protein